MKWITAFDLGKWATRTTSRALFPELIADLIRASVDDIGTFRFPNGEKGYVRGFDGVLQSDAGAKPFVPKDRSIWEFGLDADEIIAGDDFRADCGPREQQGRGAEDEMLCFHVGW